MKAHLGQEQNPEEELAFPILPSVARKGLLRELLCSSCSPAAHWSLLFTNSNS